MFNTPILLLIFNRPDTTYKVFERIKQIQPKYLFIAADGPRDEKERDLCYKARSVKDHIDWDCELKILYREENLGCGLGPAEAITWFFENVEKGIILEDDCLPSLTFFNFCEELLDYYKDEERIMHIGGTNSQFGKKRNKESYYFSKYPHIWGWATWKRAWINFKFNLTEIAPSINFDEICNHYNFSLTEKKYWQRCFDVVKYGTALDIWDIQWAFSCWAKNGITIVPNTNLISNIGFNDTATHTTSAISKLANLPTGNIRKIIHPRSIVIDQKADDYTFRNYNLLEPSTHIKIRNWLSGKLPKQVKEKLKKFMK